MKRRALIKHLKEQGGELLREGSRHSVYWNPNSSKTSTVPRHNEIKDTLVLKICKDLDITRP
ncbi:type II toxin-antitoxin system HicA family toxin, partial [Promineifilum sp.]|uniref:type II toxin-antitoxin system HicA family toxin n=1 Tax=Promineifilum sp. TaxID=2664178 RepID=UPI0035AEB814